MYNNFLMVERRVNTPEIGLWKGPNIVVSQHIILPPKTVSSVEVPVIIRPDSLPPKKDWNLGTTIPIKVSVRSRAAQAGVDMEDRIGSELFLQRQNNNYKNKPFEAKVGVINRAARPLEFLSGTGLFRLYAEKDTTIRGFTLEKMFQDGKIKIAGEKGNDWEWAFDKEGEMPIGIYIKINANNRKWLPPSGRPLLVDDKVKDYRRMLDIYLKNVPLGIRDNLLWIGETARLTLKGVNGVLDQVTQSHLTAEDSRGFGTQINSRLIDDGTDWPIRVEIFSETTWGKMPNFVRMRFIKSHQ